MASSALSHRVVREVSEEPVVSRPMRVVGPNGLHLRAASEIVKLTRTLNAEIVLEHRGVKADARSILSIACLAAEKGALVSVTATGPDAMRAIAVLAKLFEGGFGERATEPGCPSPVQYCSV